MVWRDSPVCRAVSSTLHMPLAFVNTVSYSFILILPSTDDKNMRDEHVT